MTIDLSCGTCGSNRIAFNQAVSDTCEILCEDCGGRIGTYAELKRTVTEQLARSPQA